MKGIVKWYDRKKGWGFIIRENGEDIFVHQTGVKKEGFRFLHSDSNVEFDVENSPRGQIAVNVIETVNPEQKSK